MGIVQPTIWEVYSPLYGMQPAPSALGLCDGLVQGRLDPMSTAAVAQPVEHLLENLVVGPQEPIGFNRKNETAASPVPATSSANR